MNESKVTSTLNGAKLKPSIAEFANFASYVKSIERTHKFAIVSTSSIVWGVQWTRA